jgi:hypothetical protein
MCATAERSEHAVPPHELGILRHLGLPLDFMLLVAGLEPVA